MAEVRFALSMDKAKISFVCFVFTYLQLILLAKRPGTPTREGRTGARAARACKPNPNQRPTTKSAIESSSSVFYVLLEKHPFLFDKHSNAAITTMITTARIISRHVVRANIAPRAAAALGCTRNLAIGDAFGKKVGI